MQTSLRAIALKASKDKQHKFGNLFGLLTVDSLLWCWPFLHKKAAVGVDRISAEQYKIHLRENVSDLAQQVKSKSYHAKLIRRKYIPKSSGKLRPLGIPCLQDKLLQLAVSKILQAIYEQDFLPCSYGYRPKCGAHDAVKQLRTSLQSGRYRYVVEADIRDYFGSIAQDKLLDMLRLRIADNSFVALLGKWLRAGVLDTDGQVIHPPTGTPQGAIVSPVLANVYLHHVLDTWFTQHIIPKCKGQAMLVRYADDFVCAFEFRQDAQAFYECLPDRLQEFDLQLALDKTQIICFSPALVGQTHFVFLGFEFRWKATLHGRRCVFTRTAPRKLKSAIANFTSWIKLNRNLRLSVLFALLNAKLRGYYNYYGLVGNYQRLKSFFQNVVRLLFKWLNRRSQRKSFNWQTFGEILVYYKIQRPRIVHKSTSACFP